MRNLLIPLLALTLAACAQPGEYPEIRMGGDPAPEKAKSREAGRAAGAGGSHAPGSTGLGSGTMGPELR